MIKAWEYESILQSSTKRITFIKRDKSIRSMVCTLDPKILKGLGMEQKTKQRGGVVPCVDLEIGEWRSFTAERVISMEDV